MTRFTSALQDSFHLDAIPAEALGGEYMKKTFEISEIGAVFDFLPVSTQPRSQGKALGTRLVSTKMKANYLM